MAVTSNLLVPDSNFYAMAREDDHFILYQMSLVRAMNKKIKFPKHDFRKITREPNKITIHLLRQFKEGGDLNEVGTLSFVPLN